MVLARLGTNRLCCCTFVEARYFSSHSFIDHYKVLEVAPNATAKEIKSAFYRLSKKYHPDVVADGEKDASAENFHKVSQAYEILGSEEQRKLYDMTRVRNTPSTASDVRYQARNYPREKQYTDIDIDYKDFEHFQKATRRRRSAHPHFDFPEEFFEGLGGKKREFRSDWDEESAKLNSRYRDPRAAAREMDEMQAEINRRREQFEARFKSDSLDKMLENKRKEAAKETSKYYAAMFSLSTLGLLLFMLAR
ncbi:unnamed protein product, partial [Mesorhabditis spiculigera]